MASAWAKKKCGCGHCHAGLSKLNCWADTDDAYRQGAEEMQATVTSLTKQAQRLGQCVVCGEMDEQDGMRSNGEFRCFGCVRKENEVSNGE